jgi:hypothetical protein
MAKISATERERWVLYQLINPMNHQGKAERRKWERIFDALRLEDIADKLSTYAPGIQADQRIFDGLELLELEVTSDQRDAVIALLEGPGLTTAGGRMLGRFEREIIKGRDGDVGAQS